MSTPYLTNDVSILLRVPDAKAQLISCLSDVVSAQSPTTEWKPDDLTGLYWGPTANAYLFLHLSKTHPDLLIHGKSPSYYVGAYLNRSAEPIFETASESTEPKICGTDSDYLSYHAVRFAHLHEQSDLDAVLSKVPIFLNASGFDEVCAGRAGLLYLLRLMRHWHPPAAVQLTPAMESVVTQIHSNGPSWMFSGKPYIGAAHGWMGILTQCILSIPTTAPLFTPILLTLLNAQAPSGNWPMTADLPLDPSKPGRDLVQFCHGAPGMVMSLVSLRPHFPALQARIDDAVERGRAYVWEKGLLRKMPNLCHGVVGNAFALEMGGRREHFLAYTTGEMVAKGEAVGWWEEGDYGQKWSLGCGAAGRAWGFMDLEAGGEEGLGYITYNDV